MHIITILILITLKVVQLHALKPEVPQELEN